MIVVWELASLQIYRYPVCSYFFGPSSLYALLRRDAVQHLSYPTPEGRRRSREWVSVRNTGDRQERCLGVRKSLQLGRRTFCMGVINVRRTRAQFINSFSAYIHSACPFPDYTSHHCSCSIHSLLYVLATKRLEGPTTPDNVAFLNADHSGHSKAAQRLHTHFTSNLRNQNIYTYSYQ